MLRMKLFAATASVALLVACNPSDKSTGGASDNQSQSSGQGSAASSSDNSSANTHDADNTGKNVRDRSDSSLTSGDQGSSDSDRQITRQIRRAITSNDQLSTDAKNIKIITDNGKVTLRGPVNSDQERQAIANAAQGVNGVTSLENQLEVKSSNQ